MLIKNGFFGKAFLLIVILAIISPAIMAPSQVSAAATKIAEWKLDEGTGKVTKETVSGVNDPINYVFSSAAYKPSTDPVWRTDGIAGKTLLFDGYSNWITHSAITTPANAMTVEAWVAPRAYEWGDNGILSAIVNQHDKGAKQGFILGAFRSGTWSFQVGSGGNWYEVWAYEPLPKSEWSHLIATFDGPGGAMKLYLNGKQIAATAVPVNSAITASSNQLLIGKNNQSTTLAVFPLNMFNGLIDEVKIYNGAMTAAEAQSAYDGYLTALGGNLPTANETFDRSVFDGDKYRPTYHAMAPGQWMNEPHAPVYYNGQYHLFYQNNPQGPYWHNMHWGHLVSSDMVHWRDLPPALSPELFQVDPDGDWTGSTVIDDSGNPTILFTAGNDARSYMQSNQNVGVARSTVQTDGDNDLKRWVKEQKLAITQQPGQGISGEFRDPYVFKDGSTWFLIIGSGVSGQGGTALVYTTTDPALMNWTYKGPLYQASTTAYPYLGSVWELPVLLPLGGGKHLLAISPSGAGADVEVYYWIGTWNSSTAKFTPDNPTPQLMDFGDFHFTGPSAMTDPVTGRNIMFTIAQGERTSQQDSDSGWAHNAGLPVELSLRSDGKLGINPISELQSLRGQQLVNLTTDTTFAAANTALASVTGDSLEIELELARGSADSVGLKVRKSPNSEEETLLYYKNSTDEYGVDRTKTIAGDNKGIQKGTIDIGTENVKLHVYLDKSMVESYLNGLKAITTRTYSTRSDAMGLQLWGDASTNTITVKSLKVWRMNSAYTTVPVTGVTVSPASKQVLVGGKNRLQAVVAPQNATNKNVIWSTSNASIATVVNGVVTGKAAGTATITATTRDGAKVGTSTVTVVAAPASTNLSNGGFESGILAPWTVESGTAFSNASITNSTTFSGNQPFGQTGNYHLYGFQAAGDAAVGVLKSPTFTLGGNGQINFQVGGGSDIDKLYVSFVRASDGKELFRTTGPGTYWDWANRKGVTESYTRRFWDATDYIGTSMYIKIVDDRTDGWGHINVDDFIVPVSGGSSDTQPPSAPSTLQSPSKDSSSVTLGWSASSDNVGVTGYSVFRDGIQVGVSTTTHYVDQGLTPSTTYAYAVKAFDAAGNISVASNVYSVTTSNAAPVNGLVNHDFESGDLTGWTVVSGNAFSTADVTSDVNWGWGGPFNQSGTYHLWSFKDGGDAQTGVLKSVNFTLGGNGSVDFLIGGGNDISNLYISLVRVSDGAELFKSTGNNDEAYTRKSWNAAAYVGTSCYIKIVDNATGGFGHVNIDDINVPVQQGAPSVGELANHDFESGNLSGWNVVSGNAFSAVDVTTDVNWGWGGPFNQSGTYHLWGFKDGGDVQIGVLKSANFTLGGNGSIDFLVGGGNDASNLYISLVRASDGVELFKSTGNNDEAYTRKSWNAAAYVGTSCYIKIVDNATGGFGHINIDDVNVPVAL
ncbi:GH32 C-terminal domain-containing protein [Cohnella hashimotonis]|uniref:beta-fructofuranosidase n=1 Tax=Cohnella hashimotonis TaxID=2826895 RepID=A0ABT6TCF9_9BACL|nr:GH32 C-terminal domain-containing protein [Cohnella hashimotonis]MDI4643512.1 GH32 C-terminal domain-containing protein [Cohnella hashimotonis]